MPNMSYCRFQNTLADLRHCSDALSKMGDYKNELSQDEYEAFILLLNICRDLTKEHPEAEYGHRNAK